MSSRFAVPGYVMTDADGFAPATYNGAVSCKYNTVAHTDTTAKNLFTLPLGAVVVGMLVNITTAFNSSGTDLLDIGITGTANYFANDLDVSATGQIVNGFTGSRFFATPLTAETQVTATFVQSVADASAGALSVCIFYMVR